MLSIEGQESGTLQIVDGLGRSRFLRFAGGRAELEGIRPGLYHARVVGFGKDGFQSIAVL